MTTPQHQIKSHFHLPSDEYDGEIYIQVRAKNPEVRRRLLDGICFENYDNSFHYTAKPETPNTQTIARNVFVKVFPDFKNDLKN